MAAYGPEYAKNVMFLCNHNSCRSQMAEGWIRHLRGDQSVGVASSGIVGGTAVKEGAIVVMKEAGVDITSQTSDAVADFDPNAFDVVISCCGCGAKLDPEDKKPWKERPVFQDWNLDDPPVRTVSFEKREVCCGDNFLSVSDMLTSKFQAIDPGDLSAYRRVRDECKAKCEELLNSL